MSVAPELEPLHLDNNELNNIRETLKKRVQEGLKKPDQEIRALPAYLPQPRPGLTGQALVIDAGGTNMRAALVEIKENGAFIILRGPVKDSIPTGRDGQEVTARDFFEAQARLAAQLDPPAGLPVGYCFSYAAEVLPDTDAVLLRWTKGVQIKGVEGTKVGSQLSDAMAALGFRPSKVVVLNDTVAALLAGAGARAGQFDHYLGLIAGTGTNMAYFARKEDVLKADLTSWPYSHIAINLESGNYAPPHLSPWDDAVDAESDNSGHQLFEKAVSGYYMPFIYEKVRRDLPQLACSAPFKPQEGTGKLVEMRDRENDGLAREVLIRSCDLLAAGLAGLMDCQGSGSFCIIAEGSRYWADPQAAPRIASTLSQLIRADQNFEVVRLDDANLLGSAYAALA